MQEQSLKWHDHTIEMPVVQIAGGTKKAPSGSAGAI
jgi:hypothetical protein